MARAGMTPTEAERLELLMDRIGVTAVLVNLSVLAEEKAAHIADNWQDDRLARVWNRVAVAIARAAETAAVRELAKIEGR